MASNRFYKQEEEMQKEVNFIGLIGLYAAFIRQDVCVTIILMSLPATIAAPLILRQLLGRAHP